MSRIEIGELSFQPDLHELASGATHTHLEPRVCRLFCFLLANPDRVISHQELVEQVWDGRAIGDDAIRGCVSKLRKAVGEFDGAVNIQTISKGGYRASFGPIRVHDTETSTPTPAIEQATASEPHASAPKHQRPRRRSTDNSHDCDTSKVTVEVTTHQLAFIESQLDGGRYRDHSEVIREGLRLLEQRADEEQAHLEALRKALSQLKH